MTTKTITLGDASFTIAALPLGRLKRALPAVSAVAVAMSKAASIGSLSEDTFDKIAEALSAALDIPVDQVNQIVMTPDQAIEAVLAISEVCGLAKKGQDLGEAQPGISPAMTLTPSTDSSPTS